MNILDFLSSDPKGAWLTIIILAIMLGMIIWVYLTVKKEKKQKDNQDDNTKVGFRKYDEHATENQQMEDCW